MHPAIAQLITSLKDKEPECICDLEEAKRSNYYIRVDNHPILIVRNYKMSYREDMDSSEAALSLSIEDSDTFHLSDKCWLPTPNEGIRRINDERPIYFPEYRTFVHKNTTYHPYSIRILHPQSAAEIMELLRSLRAHQLPL